MEAGYTSPDKPMMLHGVYRGQIRERKDPEKLGRCKVHVYQVHDKIPDVDLPFAWPLFMGAGIKQSGIFHVPPVGATVYVMFEMGDPDHPVWMGGFWGITGGKSEVPLMAHGQSGDPDNYVWETPIGYVEFDNREGVQKIRIRSKAGHEIVMDETEVSKEKSDTKNPDFISYKQRGIHITSADGNKIHLVDEPARGDSDPDNNKTRGITLEDAEGNSIIMDIENSKLIINWDGDKEENISGNFVINVGGTYQVDAAGDVDITSGEELTMQSAGDINELSDGEIMVTALKSHTTRAPRIAHLP